MQICQKLTSDTVGKVCGRQKEKIQRNLKKLHSE